MLNVVNNKYFQCLVPHFLVLVVFVNKCILQKKHLVKKNNFSGGTRFLSASASVKMYNINKKFTFI